MLQTCSSNIIAFPPGENNKAQGREAARPNPVPEREDVDMDRNKFAGYLLVTDMDGTLLDSEKRISPENEAAIRRFTEQGGRFTLATGRIAASAKPYADRLPLNAPAILYNGVVIHDFKRGENVWEQTLPVSCAGVLERVKSKFPGIGIEIYPQGADIPYFLQDNLMTERHRRIEGFPERPISSPGEAPGPWSKILFAWDPELLDEYTDTIVAQTQGAEIEWVRSDDRYLEILPFGATKGHALERLMDMLDIPRENTIALGDHLNDLEMIRRAGTGIAVANAHPNLLSEAKRRGVHHNEHAIADAVAWLERRIDGEEG